MSLAIAIIAALAITPRSCDKPSVSFPPKPTSPALVAAAQSDAALRRRTTLAVGMALCNDVLLLLMLVPMLPHLLPAGSSALALSFVFSAKDAAQLLLAPLAFVKNAKSKDDCNCWQLNCQDLNHAQDILFLKAVHGNRLICT